MLSDQSVPHPESAARRGLGLFAIAAAVAAGLFLVESRINLNVADEGFLWYGVIRTSHGAVPLRDFQAYDPARYYLLAPAVALLGPTLPALRAGLAVFQAVAVFFGLLVVRRLTARPAHLVFVAVVCLLWIQPGYKAFEALCSLGALWVLTCLAERPESPRRWFGIGMTVGLAVFVGRNLALYTFAAAALMVPALLGRAPSRWLGAAVFGLVAGCLPVLVMASTVPGFGEAWWAFALENARRGSVLMLPFPWPWSLPSLDQGIWEAVWRVLLGCVFVVTPAIAVAAAVRLWLNPAGESSVRAVACAAAACGAGFLHYALSRADLEHLAVCAQPLVIGVGALLILLTPSRPSRARVAWLLSIGAVTAGLVGPVRPFARLVNPSGRLRGASVVGTRMWIDPEMAEYLEAVEAALTEHVGRHDRVWFAPFAPGLYPIVGRDSPTRELSMLFPGPAGEQEQMIAQLEATQVRWIVLQDSSIPAVKPVRFSWTHPLVSQYVATNFVPVVRLPEATTLYRRRP
jgi:hypothetical protein